MDLGIADAAACDYRFGSSARPRIMLFGLLVLAIGIGGAAITVVARYPLGVAKCVTRNSYTV